MAKLSQDSRRMYSWWWDSHISPKNSKWLQENLTDMDAKVKVMIKLIEEDADSFARRAEMYYKKRPELMRLVEEFYRAYRAMAERYDHATGVIRHAHRTMAEAFPNQVPLMFADDSPVSSGADPRTPDMSTPTRALSEENDISNDVPDLSSSNSHAAKQNGEFTDDPASSGIRRKTLKQLKGRPFTSIESVQKGLNFDETEDKEHGTHTNQNHHFRDGKLSKPDQINESEEILMLKEALARLETEKEAGLVQYQKNLDKLSQLESEISRSREDFRVLRDHATKAENEAVILKESLSKLETEKELKLQEYQRCMDRLSDLENIISMAQEDAEKQNQRASTAETEAQSFKAELDKLAVEKDAALNQYMKSLETISILENKVQLIEEDAMRLQERAENTENEVELLKQTISKLTDEKEAIARQYQQCLETISSLEERLKCAQEEAKILNVEIDNGVSKLKGAEEQCLLLERSNQSLHSELESLMLKMGTQTQELTEKQQELGRLWGCVQEERMRFVEAETAFQTLQHLHSQTQEELQSMASELQKRAQLLKVADTQNQSLKDEVLLIRKENKHLDELNASSSLSIMDMQNEISSLKESKEKLKEEIELRIDQRNALQQEIYCLKEELNDLNKKHLSVLEQVHTVGLNPDSFGSSVRQLQEENSNIKENCHRERSEKEALLGKLEIFEQLLEKNSVLETSLSDLNAELEAVRGKIEALEQSLQSLLKEKSDLLDEKATITIQLQETNKNMENLMENNTVVVNSLSDAHYQLEALKANLKELEDSCRLLANEKAGLISEKDGLTSQLENTQMRVEELEKVYGELEGRYIALEKQRESTLHKVEELQMSSEVERKEHANYIQMNESRFIGVEAEMRLLREECNWRKRELDEVLDIAISDEIEMFVLCRTAQELEVNNFSLLIKNQKLLEESILSEEKISQLEKINFGQEIEIKSLCDQGSCLRAGTYQLMKVLDIVQNHASVDEADQDQVSVQLLLCKLQDMKKSLCKAEEENQKWAVELSILVTWMMQLRLQAQNMKAENDNIEHEFKVQTEQLLVVQSEVHKLLETNEELRSKLQDEGRNKEAVMIQIEDLRQNIMYMQSTCDVLQRERSELCEEKRSLMEKTLHLEEKNNILEEENCVFCGEVLALDNLSLIFRNCAEEKSKVQAEQLLVVQREVHKLLETNENLRSKLQDEGRNKEAVMIQIEDLRRNILDMQSTCDVLYRERSELCEEKRSLMEKTLRLAEKNNILEEENCVLYGEVLAVDNLSLIFRNCAEEKSKVQTEQLLVVQSEVHKLLERNEELRSKLQDEGLNKEAMMIQIEDLRRNIMGMQSTCDVLQRERSELCEEKRSLLEKTLRLEEKNNILEEENCVLCGEVLALDNLSLIFRNCAEEKLMVSKELGDNINELHAANGVLMGKLSSTEGRLEESEVEMLLLKERLQKSEDDLKLVVTVRDQLSGDIENGKNRLHQMELVLQEAEQKIGLVEKEKYELHKIVEDLRTESDQFKIVRDGQENQIFELSTNNNHLSTENDHLHEAIQILEAKLHESHEKHNKSKSQGENLHFELKGKINEIDELEIQAASVFGQLQYSMVCQLLFEQKFHELHETCLDYIDQNEGLKNQISSYGPEIVSLKECIASLENHTDSLIKLQNPEKVEFQGAEVTNDPHKNNQNNNERTLMPDMFSDLQDLHARLQAIERTSVAMKELMVQENMDLRSKLDASTRQVELLKSGSGHYRRSLKQTSEITEADNALLTKDIMLDQISNGSPYGLSKREPIEMDNQTVELWENADPDGIPGLAVGKSEKIRSPSTVNDTDFYHDHLIKEQKGEFPASGELIKKELSVDKLEISKRFTESIQEGNKRKVLERIDSDVQKLANLQMTVQDLKTKLEVTEKGTRGKAVIECESLKGQLDEADVAIKKLFDFNGRLMKTIEDSSFSDVKLSSFDLEGDGNARKRVSEQARRMSEKIGRLQLEVQKLQFILLKLDDEKEGKTKISETKRRILLRDYLYGGRRKGQGRRKAQFCGCIQPSTIDD